MVFTHARISDRNHRRCCCDLHRSLGKGEHTQSPVTSKLFPMILMEHNCFGLLCGYRTVWYCCTYNVLCAHPGSGLQVWRGLMWPSGTWLQVWWGLMWPSGTWLQVWQGAHVAIRDLASGLWGTCAAIQDLVSGLANLCGNTEPGLQLEGEGEVFIWQL